MMKNRILIYCLMGIIPYMIMKAFFNSFEGGFFIGIGIAILWQIVDEKFLDKNKKLVK